jgi:hypothetical protein
MQATQRRTVVDIDTRRAVFMVAGARKPADVVKVPHDAFIRNALKDRLGWPRNEPAPESIKAAAKAMAQQFVERDKKLAAAKAAAKAAEAAKQAEESLE